MVILHGLKRLPELVIDFRIIGVMRGMLFF